MRIKPVDFHRRCFALGLPIPLFAVLVGLVVFWGGARPACAAGRQFLPGQVPAAVSRLQPMGLYPGTNRLNLAIGLPLRNEAALDELIRRLYDPASPDYRQYLTPEQFTEQFGPTEQNYQAVIDFAKANGLTITGTHPNRAVLDVSGSVADVERVFHVTLRTYHHPREARTFYAPDAEPSIDLAVPLLHVSGLDNYARQHPANLTFKAVDPAAGRNPNAGSGPDGSYRGYDFRAAYLPGVTTNQLSGVGQSIALVQFDGYYSNDIALYERQAGLPSVPLTNILVDSFSGNPSSDTNQVAEVSLDIEMVISMAPNVSRVLVYEAPNGSAWVDILSRIANDNLAKQIGCSWGGGNPDSASETVFKQMATQGQSFYNASGDSDAFTGSVPFPADSTNITQVGGTTLSTSGPGGVWLAETVWNWGGGEGSSGGVSTYYKIPTWQKGINMTTNQGSTTFRNIPDVALTADGIYVIANNGRVSTTTGGTSVATPLWAGFTALVNQQAVAKGKATVGFVNPAIYTIGEGPNYAADFHDITTGDNTWSGSATKYFAVPGYDLCTGWGTPNGMSLINDLATPDTLGLSPGTGFTVLGPVGGPFNTNAQTFTLTNMGATSLTWSLTGLPAWLNASLNGSTLASHAQTNVTVSLNSAYGNLPVGLYTTNLVFTNLTSGIPRSRLFTFQTGLSYVLNGGFESGGFDGWNFIGTGPYANFVDNGSIITSILPHSGSDVAILGESPGFAYLSQTLTTVPGQKYLLSFWLDAPSSGSVQQFIVNWNTNATSTNTIYNQTFPNGTPWINPQFVVTATGPNTILQIAARNDPYYFGLDDINVWPLPIPSFRSISTVNPHGVALTWNSLTNISYRVEYSTNLANPNWTPLVTNTATGFTLTITNSFGTDPHRFYRTRQLP